MDFWETHLWEWFSWGQFVVIALSLLAMLGALAVRYARTKRWDRAWKDRWERGHGDSLDALRRIKQRNKKNLMLFRWVMFALFFMGLGASLWPIYGMIRGLRRLPLLVIEAMITLNLALLLVLVAAILAVEVARSEIKRIDELLEAESTPRLD